MLSHGPWATFSSEPTDSADSRLREAALQSTETLAARGLVEYPIVEAVFLDSPFVVNAGWSLGLMLQEARSRGVHMCGARHGARSKGDATLHELKGFAVELATCGADGCEFWSRVSMSGCPVFCCGWFAFESQALACCHEASHLESRCVVNSVAVQDPTPRRTQDLVIDWCDARSCCGFCSHLRSLVVRKCCACVFPHGDAQSKDLALCTG